MGREQEIEDRVVTNLAWFGYPDASWIRRAKMGREGFGAVDLILLPKGGPHRLVLVEVKHQDSNDTPGRLVGQLLAYYLAALRFGSDGLECLQRFARSDRAHDTRPKSLQMLSGLGRGCRPRDLEALRAGTKLTPPEIGLIVVWGRNAAGEESRESFLDLRNWLRDKGGLDVRLVLARPDGSFESAAGAALTKAQHASRRSAAEGDAATLRSRTMRTRKSLAAGARRRAAELEVVWKAVRQFPSSLGHGVQLMSSSTSGSQLIGWIEGFEWLHSTTDRRVEILIASDASGLPPRRAAALRKAVERILRTGSIPSGPICRGVSAWVNG